MGTYITNDERYLLEWINGHYDIRAKDIYPIRPVARELIEEKGYDSAIDLLNHVLFQIDKRRNRARSGYNIYVLGCYYDWVNEIKADIIGMKQAREARLQTGNVFDVKAFVRSITGRQYQSSVQANPQ